MRTCVIVGSDSKYNKELQAGITLNIALDMDVIGIIKLSDFSEVVSSLKPDIVIVTQKVTRALIGQIKKVSTNIRNYNPIIFTIVNVITSTALVDMKEAGIKKYYLRNEPVINIVENIKNVIEKEDRKINSFLMDNTHNVESLIHNTLSHLGIPINSMGFNQIRYALLLCYQDEKNIYRITKSLYLKIAEQYNTSVNAVERNIRTCIGKMILNQTSLFQSLFGGINQITNKLFLHVVLHYIKTAPYKQYVNVYI